MGFSRLQNKPNSVIFLPKDKKKLTTSSPYPPRPTLLSSADRWGSH